MSDAVKDNQVKVNDRRFWQRGKSDETAAAPEAAAPDIKPGYVQELEAQLKQREEEIAQLGAGLRMLRDEQRKVRERLEREQQNELLQFKIRVIEPLLETLDNLERCSEALKETAQDATVATAGLREGVPMIAAQFRRTLETLGVTRVDVVGKPYNPDVAEAVAAQPSNDPKMDNIVMQEYRSGYTIADRLIRPARVSVGKHTEGNDVRSSDSPTGHPQT